MKRVKFVDDFDKKNRIPKVKVFLKREEGDVSLMAEEESGMTWYVLALCRDGVIRTSPNLPESLGLRLDAEGGVIIEKE